MAARPAVRRPATGDREPARDLVRSATFPQLSGAIFISRQAAADVATGAEMILHEALHAKLDMILECIPLLRSDPRQERDASIVAVWHAPDADGTGNRWTVLRALAAFHVYAHLVVLAEALAAGTLYGARGVRLRSRALFRAHYLIQAGPPPTRPSVL